MVYNEINIEKFHDSLLLARTYSAGGIGTLGEKTIHSVLKHYISSSASEQEKAVSGRIVADIMTEQGEIFEIQSRNFSALKTKLKTLLKSHKVTIVYPVAHKKRLFWVDPASGNIDGGRLSPKAGQAYSILFELYPIKEYLTDPNLNLRIILMDIDEYRVRDGWDISGKKGSSRYEGIPDSIFCDITIENPSDLKYILPELPDVFTSRDISRCMKVHGLKLSSTINVLLETGIICRTAKKGNAFLYCFQ